MAPDRKRHAIQAPDDAWGRLGELLQLRRAELGYRRRPAFTRDRNINIRLVTDIEMNYRPGTFQTSTLGDIAAAYAVTYDSMAAVLAREADKLITVEPVPPPAAGSDSRQMPPETAADALAGVPAALREVRNLAARIEQLLAASGDPAASEALRGYVDRALRRVQIEVEELLAEADLTGLRFPRSPVARRAALLYRTVQGAPTAHQGTTRRGFLPAWPGGSS
jgi:hypothetical protein